MNFKNFSQKVSQFFQAATAPADGTAFTPEMDEDGIVQANKNWQPQRTRRRIEIMVTGDPSRVEAVADAIDDVQNQIFEDAPKPDNIELRITAFLDGCIHRSKWNKKPIKAAAEAKKWECEQSKTRFADALADSHGELVDTVVLIGHRFDEDVQEALAKAAALKEQGVHIHCFHTGRDAESEAIYKQLAEETGGIFMQLADQRSLSKVMPLMMAHLNDEDALLKLHPRDDESKKLLRMLNPEAPEILEASRDPLLNPTDT